MTALSLSFPSFPFCLPFAFAFALAFRLMLVCLDQDHDQIANKVIFIAFRLVSRSSCLVAEQFELRGDKKFCEESRAVSDPCSIPGWLWPLPANLAFK